jgi:hypothetical protein
MTTLSFAVSLLAAAPIAHAQGNPSSPGTSTATASARQVITSAEQLPRRVVKLDKLPSQYLDAPRAEVLALAEALRHPGRSHDAGLCRLAAHAGAVPR